MSMSRRLTAERIDKLLVEKERLQVRLWDIERMLAEHNEATKR